MARRQNPGARSSSIRTSQKIIILTFISMLLICSLIISVILLAVIMVVGFLWQYQSTKMDQRLLENKLTQLQDQRNQIQQLLKQQQMDQQSQRQQFDLHTMQSLEKIQQSFQAAAKELREQIGNTLSQNTQALNQQVKTLTEKTREHLKDISEHVNKQLTSGFENTAKTFSDIQRRLTLIDQAQQKMTELSTQVVSLQDILTDKRSRGAFGEIQLNALVRNMIPTDHFDLQKTLSNGKRADCLLYLPRPTGNIVIDAKFPLESFKACRDNMLGAQKTKLHAQFSKDIKKHIDDIANKYILPGETAEGAMMFIPAEAIFADIHAYYREVVEYAYQKRVWLTSPTTMMAILTTARAVLKDSATRQQAHIIQKHLVALSKDFIRFQKRMDQLAQHIQQAHTDVGDIHISAKKITSRFSKIEKVEWGETEDKQKFLAV